MTNQKHFLTVQEACIYSSKAEKTIRNLIKNLIIKNDDNTFSSKDIEKVLVKKNGKKFFYLVSKDFLDTHFNKKNKEVGESPKKDTSNNTSKEKTNTSKKNKSNSKTTSTIKENDSNQKYIDLIIDQQKAENSHLKELLKEKDKQIASFQERQRENNILIKDLHSQLSLNAPQREEQGTNAEYEEVKEVEKDDTEEGSEEPKKGFWSGLFS